MLLTLKLWPRRGRNRTGSRTEPKPQLTEEQWLIIADLFADPKPSSKGGRPRVPARWCLEGILWVLKTGARWQDLPTHFPSPCTCWRRLNEWTQSGVFPKAWKRLLGKLDRFRGIDWEEGMADGTFSPAKKGAPRLVRPKRAKERRSCCSSMATGLRWPQ